MQHVLRMQRHAFIMPLSDSLGDHAAIREMFLWELCRFPANGPRVCLAMNRIASTRQSIQSWTQSLGPWRSTVMAFRTARAMYRTECCGGYSCNHCHPLNLHGPLRRLSNCVSQGEPEFHSTGCGDHCVRCHFHLGTSLSLHWRRSEYLSSRTSSSASHFGHALAFADQCVWVHHNIACGDT